MIVEDLFLSVFIKTNFNLEISNYNFILEITKFIFKQINNYFRSVIINQIIHFKYYFFNFLISDFSLLDLINFTFIQGIKFSLGLI